MSETNTNPFIGDKFFNDNPEKVCGEQTIGGAYGTSVIVRGSIDDIDNKLSVKMPEKTFYIDQEEQYTDESINDIASHVIQETKKNFKDDNYCVSCKYKRLKETKEEHKSGKYDVSKQEVYSMRDMIENKDGLRYNEKISRKELEAFLYSFPELPHEKYIDSFEYTEEELIKEGLLFYIKGRIEYKYIYISGNLSQKRMQLRGFDKETIISKYGEAVYENQVNALKDSLPRRKYIGSNTNDTERIIILPTSDISNTFKIKEVMDEAVSNMIYGEMSLKDVFENWVNKIDSNRFKKSKRTEVVRYYIRNKRLSTSGKSKAEKEESKKQIMSIKQRVKQDGDRLFDEFLCEQLIPEDKFRLEQEWNDKFNSLVEPDYSKIPVAFRFSKNFKSDIPLELSETQRDGVAFYITKRSCILGYDVGVGKTLTLNAILSYAIDNNLSKFPLIVVPNNVYKKWIGELQGYYDEDRKLFLKGSNPHLPKVRSLYNLNVNAVLENKEYNEQERKEIDDILSEMSQFDSLSKDDAFDKYYQNQYMQQAIEAYEGGLSMRQRDYEVIKMSIQEATSERPSPYSEKDLKAQDAVITKFIKGKDDFIYDMFSKSYKKYMKAIYEHKIYTTGRFVQVPEGTISLITFEGLRKLGLRDNEDVVQHLYNILMQGDKYEEDQREAAKLYDRLKERVEGAVGNSKIYIDDLGIDFYAFDEAHKSKKIFTSVKGNIRTNEDGEIMRDKSGRANRESSSYDLDFGQPSSLALSSYIFSSYVQKRNNNRNVVLLSATPFENNPLEVYSMLSLANHKELENNGFGNLTDFFDTFMKIDYEIKLTAKNDVQKDQTLIGFNNLPQLRTLIRYIIDYKTGEEANVNRPDKVVLPSEEWGVKTTMNMSSEQAEFMDLIEKYINGDISLNQISENIAEEENLDGDEAEKNPADQEDGMESKTSVVLKQEELNEAEQAGVRVLQGISMMQQIALNPYLFKPKRVVAKEPTYKEYVEASPKILYALYSTQSIHEYHKANNSKPSGVVIYANAGINIKGWQESGFTKMRKYLIKELGYEEEQVKMIYGGMTASAKERVKTEFLSGECLVVIGSKAIEVGVDLQDNASALFNLYFGWNPTDAKQVEGRIWRQGNRFGSVRVAYPMLEDSVDPVMFQYLYEKTMRLKEIWDRDQVKSQLDLRDFDPNKLKYELITDPKKRAKIEIINEKDKWNDELMYLSNQLDDVQKVAPAISAFYSAIKFAVPKIVSFLEAKQKLEKREISEEWGKRKQGLMFKLSDAEDSDEREKVNSQIDKATTTYEKNIKDSDSYFNDKINKIENVNSHDSEKEYYTYVYAEAGKVIKWTENPVNQYSKELELFAYKKDSLRQELVQFRGAYKQYVELKRKVLEPLGLTEAEVGSVSEKFQLKIDDVKTKLEEIESTFEERVRTLEEERKQKKRVDWATRVTEFDSLNEKLLNDFSKKPIKKQKAKTIKVEKDDNEGKVKKWQLAVKGLERLINKKGIKPEQKRKWQLAVKGLKRLIDKNSTVN